MPDEAIALGLVLTVVLATPSAVRVLLGGWVRGRACKELVRGGIVSTATAVAALVALCLSEVELLRHAGLVAILGTVVLQLGLLVIGRVVAVKRTKEPSWLPPNRRLFRLMPGTGCRISLVTAILSLAALPLAKPPLQAEAATAFGPVSAVAAVAVASCLALVFLSVPSTLIALAPPAFALVCTMAGSHLLGWPIGLAGLTVPVLVWAVGADATTTLLRPYQRGLSLDDPLHGLARLSVVGAALALGVALLIGIELAPPEFRDAAVLALVAMAFCYAAVADMAAPLLRRMYEPRPLASAQPSTPERWVRHRYRLLEPYPRLFARFKLMLDPMFDRLAEFVPSTGTVLDVGCGFGVAAAWLLARSDQLRVVAIEPDEDRASIARYALGERGQVHVGAVPSCWPQVQADAVLLLDVAHYMDDASLQTTLQQAWASLGEGGRLVMRETVCGPRRFPWERWLEQRRLAFRGIRMRFRGVEELQAMLENSGFRLVYVGPSARGREETWLIAERQQ